MGTKIEDDILDMICEELESTKSELLLSTAKIEKSNDLTITGHNMWDFPRAEVASSEIREKVRFLKKYLNQKYGKYNISFLAIGEPYKCTNWQTNHICVKLKITWVHKN